MEQNFSISQNAANQITHLLSKEENPDLKLRITVDGGGCAGFQYQFGFDDNQTADDLLIEDKGVALLIDEVSLELLSGSELDYVEDLIGASFQIKNPNASSTCGCGSSFSL